MATNLLQKHWEWQEDRTPMLRHGCVVRPTMYLASMDIKTACDVARPRHVAKIMETGTHMNGWLRLSCERCRCWKVKQCLNAWRAITFLIDVCAREASKPHVCGGKWPLGFWLMCKKDGWRKVLGIFMDFEDERAHKICSFSGPTIFGLCRTQRKRIWSRCYVTWLKKQADGIWYPNRRVCGGQARVHDDLHHNWMPQLSIWRSSRSWDMPWIGNGNCTTPLVEECSQRTRYFGRIFWFSEAKIFSGKWSAEDWLTTNMLSVLTLDKIKEWETKTMLRLFRFKRHKEETWVDNHKITCNMARKIWMQMGLPFLYDVIAESTWRAMRWACHERSNAAIGSPKTCL